MDGFLSVERNISSFFFNFFGCHFCSHECFRTCDILISHYIFSFLSSLSKFLLHFVHFNFFSFLFFIFLKYEEYELIVNKNNKK